MKQIKSKIEQTAGENNPGNKQEAQIVNLSDDTIEAIADAIAERIAQKALPYLLLHARLCAADTVRTSERPDTVFRHAIKEAEIARVEIDKHFQAKNA